MGFLVWIKAGSRGYRTDVCARNKEEAVEKALERFREKFPDRARCRISIIVHPVMVITCISTGWGGALFEFTDGTSVEDEESAYDDYEWAGEEEVKFVRTRLGYEEF